MEPELIDGKYQIVRLLGEGGMGAVYEARHLGTGRRVAVKVISGDALKKSTGIVDRFQREARATGSIETQHIAHVLDTGKDGATGNPYLVMEFLQGEDLQQLIERLGPLAPDLALRVVAQACAGLVCAHEAGVVHRDIKPANLYLARRDAGEVVVKVLDFGIAKVKMDELSRPEKGNLTRTGAMLGSPLYMSPEQAQGAKNIDGRTDVWSLGVVLYEALTGKTPHGNIDTLGGLILAICSKPPQHVQEGAPWVVPAVAAIVHKALAIEPADRYQSATELLAAVRAQLPHGTSLNESMLVPLGETTRALVEPRLEIELAKTMPAPDVGGVPSSTARTSGGAASQRAPGTTTAGLAHSHADEERPVKRSMPLVLGGAAILVVGGLVAFRYVGRSVPTAPTSLAATSAPSEAAPTPSPATGAVTSSTASLTASAAAAASTRSVSLGVAPPDARVDVDGVSATIANGVVILTGTLGSSHKVHVASGKRETTVDVVVAEVGAVPSHVELDAHPAPGGRPAGAGAPAPPPTPPTFQRDFH